MEEKMLGLAERLKNNDSVLDVFKKLEEILDKNGLWEELIGCKEKIWHLTGDDKKLKEMCVLYREQLNNADMGYLISMLYIYRTDRDIYNELVASFNAKELSSLDTGFDETTDSFSELLKISDRYCGLEYIASYFNLKQQYDEIYRIMPYFDQVKNEADEYLKNHSNADSNDIADMSDCDKKLSIMFSNNTDNVKLNELAIKLDEDNEKAYANVIESYVINKNEDKAIEFYNEKYRKKFNICENKDSNDYKNKAVNFADVIWELSKYYYDNADFYKSLHMQQLGINYELEHNTENGDV